jgi:hypothetical protein
MEERQKRRSPKVLHFSLAEFVGGNFFLAWLAGGNRSSTVARQIIGRGQKGI